MEAVDRTVFVYTDPKELEQVRHKLAAAGFSSEHVNLEFHPSANIPITDEKTAEKIIKLATALDDLDDVARVSSNFELPDNLVE